MPMAITITTLRKPKRRPISPPRQLHCETGRLTSDQRVATSHGAAFLSPITVGQSALRFLSRSITVRRARNYMILRLVVCRGAVLKSCCVHGGAMKILENCLPTVEVCTGRLRQAHE